MTVVASSVSTLVSLSGTFPSTECGASEEDEDGKGDDRFVDACPVFVSVPRVVVKGTEE